MLPVPHSRSINSNFEADVLETQAKLGKMLMIFVISISKLTKTARSDDEVRGAYSDRLLVSHETICQNLGKVADSCGGLYIISKLFFRLTFLNAAE